MPLIDMKNIGLSFGGPQLLDSVDFVIEPGERICLLGRNGEGKSSRIKIINGDVQPDRGEVAYSQGLRLGLLEQEVPGGMPGTVFDVVAGGISGLGCGQIHIEVRARPKGKLEARAVVGDFHRAVAVVANH